MIWGLTTSTFTAVHVALSLIGIVSGIVVLIGLLYGRWLSRWNAVFLVTTIATSVTGFGFPFRLEPPQIVGIVSLLVLAVAVFALYGAHLAGAWRRIYVISSITALYLNVFVLVAQLFDKVPALKALAPTQREPPFAIAQLVVLVLFAVLGVRATKRSHGRPVLAA